MTNQSPLYGPPYTASYEDEEFNYLDNEGNWATLEIKQKYAVVMSMAGYHVAVRVGSKAWGRHERGFACYGFDDLKSARDYAKYWNNSHRTSCAESGSRDYTGYKYKG